MCKELKMNCTELESCGQLYKLLGFFFVLMWLPDLVLQENLLLEGFL